MMEELEQMSLTEASFEGSNAHKNELFDKAKKFLRERKEDKK
jgi:hypothetical protein